MKLGIRGLMARHGFSIGHLGGNVTGYVRSLRNGNTIIVQSEGAGTAPRRASERVCAYWLGREHSEPLREVCGSLDTVLRKAGKRL